MSDDDDFGFSIVSETEVNNPKIETAQNKLEQLRKLILPLLNNLAKDDNKDYIHWPNRSKKLKELIGKINKIVDNP
jgi:hypothetical protein